MTIKLKEQALFTLLNDYIDVYGGTTLTHISQSNPLLGQYNNENQHLFNGEMALLIKLSELENSIYYEKIIANYLRHLELCQVVTSGRKIPGLYARHPDPYKFSDEFHGLSRDEHAGMAFLSVAIDRPIIMQEIIEYGKQHNYAYIEEEPGYDPIKAAGGNLLAAIKKIFYNKEDKLVQRLSRVRQYNDRSFYKLCAGESPTIFELFQMYIGLIMSSASSKEITSGKMMSFFKIKSLDLVGHNTILFRITKAIFRLRMRYLYGNNYMKAVAEIYFKDKNHPIHTLIDGVV